MFSSLAKKNIHSSDLRDVTMLLSDKCQYALTRPFKFCSIYFSCYNSLSCLEKGDFVHFISKPGASLSAKIEENCLYSSAKRYVGIQDFFNLAKNLIELMVIKNV